MLKKFKSRFSRTRETKRKGSASSDQPPPPIEPLDETQIEIPKGDIQKEEAVAITLKSSDPKHNTPVQDDKQVSKDVLATALAEIRSKQPVAKSEETFAGALFNTIDIHSNLSAHLKPREPGLHEIDPEALSPYKYTPLPTPTCFRLLQFSTTEITLPLGLGSQKLCKLLTFKRDQAPPYLCLSYTWGCPVDHPDLYAPYSEMETWVLASPETKSEEKEAGEYTRIPIGKNLYLAMKQMFKTKSSVEYIWIDALCINQTDNEEKAIQLTAMGDIYAQSLRTVVWLGEGTLFDTALAKFYILHSLVLPKLAVWMQEHGVQSLTEGWDEASFYERLGLHESSCEWSQYMKFYRQRTYFQRTWVVQEIAFSKELLVIISHHVLGWEEMAFLARFLRISGLEDHFLVADSDSEVKGEKEPGQQEAIPLIESWAQLRIDTIGIGTEAWLTKLTTKYEIDDKEMAVYLFFFDVLRLMRPGHATDARDKIFAAYGFLQKALQPLGIQPRFTPTYAKSVGQIYNEIGAMFLEVLPDFMVLSETQHVFPRPIKELASWIPNYAFRRHVSLYARARYDKYNAGCALSAKRERLDESLYTITAEPDEKPFVTLHQCHLLDSIVHVAEKPPPEAFVPNDVAKMAMYQQFILQEWKLLMSHLRPAPNEPKNSYNDWSTLFHTMLANQLESPSRPTIQPGHFKKYLLTTYALRRQLLTKLLAKGSLTHAELEANPEQWPNDTPHTWSEDAARYPEYIPSWDEMTAYSETLNSTNYILDESKALAVLCNLQSEDTVFIDAATLLGVGKQLFATRDGRIGLGPESMADGDKVLVIKGARMVYVVRKYEGGEEFSLYQFIGEAYVHGVMDGEVAEGVDAEEGWTRVNII